MLRGRGIPIPINQKVAKIVQPMQDKMREKNLNHVQRNACIASCVLKSAEKKKVFVDSKLFPAPRLKVEAFVETTARGISNTGMWELYNESKGGFVNATTIDSCLAVFLDLGISDGGKISVIDNKSGACVYTNKKNEKWLVLFAQMTYLIDSGEAARVLMPELPSDLHGCLVLYHDIPTEHFYVMRSEAKNFFEDWYTVDSLRRNVAGKKDLLFKIRKLILEGLGDLQDVDLFVSEYADKSQIWKQYGSDCGLCALSYILHVLGIVEDYSAFSSSLLRRGMYFLLVMVNEKNRFISESEDLEKYHTNSGKAIIDGKEHDFKMKMPEAHIITLDSERTALYKLLLDSDPEFRAKNMKERHQFITEMILPTVKKESESVDSEEEEETGPKKKSKRAHEADHEKESKRAHEAGHEKKSKRSRT